MNENKYIEYNDIEKIAEDFQNTINTLQSRIDPLEENILDIIGIHKLLEEYIGNDNN